MKKFRMTRTALAAAALLLLFAFASAKEKYEEKFEKTMSLPKGGKVQISNISGDIGIVTWGQDQVKIDAVKVSQADSLDKAKENAAKVNIEVTMEGNVLRIETKYPKSGKVWGGESVSVSVSYKLSIPAWAAMKANNISGDIVAENLGGAADLSAISGDVKLKKATQGADCSTISGNLEIADITGDVFLKSVSGELTATQVKGSIQAESVSGDVELSEVSEAGSVRVKALSGEIIYRGSINKAGTYNLKSHSGNIDMYLPASAGFDFEAESFSGGITSDFEIKVSGKVSPKEMRGVVNNGGATVKLTSFSGDIRLRKT
jgi:DUF4097 and DUF4098 domain-containing protein YvlB